MQDEWSGLADLLANLIEKYAIEIDIDALPLMEAPPRLSSAASRICDEKNAARFADAPESGVNQVSRRKQEKKAVIFHETEIENKMAA